MRARTNFAIDVVAAVAYVLSTNPVATGTPAHEWLGIGAAFVALVHLVSHWRQTAGVLKRFFGSIGRLHRLNLVVDLPLLVAFVTVAMSGLLVSRSALKPLGWVASDTSVWHAVHSQSATVLLVLMGVHLGLHWSWIASAVRHRIFRPMLHPVAALAWARSRVMSSRTSVRARTRTTLGRAAGHVAQATVLVALLAVGIYGLTVSTNGAYLAAGLTMPGGSGVGLSEVAPSTRAASLSDARADTLRAEAESRGISRTALAAIRSAHAFLILGLAMVAGAVIADLLRPVRA